MTVPPVLPPQTTIVPLPMSRPPLIRVDGDESKPPLMASVPADSVAPSTVLSMSPAGKASTDCGVAIAGVAIVGFMSSVNARTARRDVLIARTTGVVNGDRVVRHRADDPRRTPPKPLGCSR